jgi:hypothetical protein
MLASHALRHEHVSYFNITPNSNTLPIPEAQGCVKYFAGRFVAVPMISAGAGACHVEVATPGICVFLRRRKAAAAFRESSPLPSAGRVRSVCRYIGRFLAWRGIPPVVLDRTSRLAHLLAGTLKGPQDISRHRINQLSEARRPARPVAAMAGLVAIGLHAFRRHKGGGSRRSLEGMLDMEFSAMQSQHHRPAGYKGKPPLPLGHGRYP